MADLTNRQLAAQLRRDARVYAAEFRKGVDADVRAQVACDVADLMAVAELLQRGQLLDVAGAMDALPALNGKRVARF